MRLAPAADVFVGREAELAALAKWSAMIGAPRAGVAVIVGEAGVGKSTLLGRAFGDWEDSGGLLLTGGGIAIPGLEGLQSPFGMFVEALRAVLSRVDVEARTRDLVSRWLDSSRRAGELDPAHRRREELLEIVQALSSTGPVLLALEDLHWVDPSSLGALVFLVRQLTSERVGVVATSRQPVGSGALPPFASVLEHLQRLPGALAVELGAFTAAETAELARAHGATDRDQLDTIVTLAEGNALAAVEMASAGARGAETPASVRAAVQDWWEALSADARRTLGAAAVIGSEIPHALLSRVSHSNEVPTVQEGSAAMPEILGTGLLQSTQSGYRFRHALDRRAVYELVLPAERIRLHESVARQLAAQAIGQARRNAQLAAEIAAHWSLTDKAEETAAACVDAGMAAYEMGAYPEAQIQLDRGLQQWLDTGADAGLLHLRPREVVQALVDCWVASGTHSNGVGPLRRLAPHLSGDELAHLHVNLGRLLVGLGEQEASDEAFRLAIAAAESAHVRAEVQVRYSSSLAAQGRDSVGRPLVEEGLAVLGHEESPWRVKGLVVLAAFQAAAGEAEQAICLIDEGRRIALRINDERELWLCLSNALYVMDMAGLPQAGLDLALEIVDRARRSRLVRSEVAQVCLANAVEAMVDMGRWDEAVSLSEEICGLRDPTCEAEAGTQMQWALVQLRRGEIETASRRLARARHVTGSEWITSWVDLYRFEAERHVWAGALTVATATIAEGIDKLGLATPKVGIDVLPFVMVGLRVTSDAVAIPELRERALTLAARLEAAVADVLTRPQSEGSLWIGAQTSLALAESARGRGVDEPAQWRRAVDAWRARLNPYQVAYCQFREAESRVEHGDRRGAQAPLREALATAEQLHAAPLADALTALARRARIALATEEEQSSPTVPPRAAAAGLTHRECEVLQLLLDGLTNRQIARSLTISERTVGVHVSNVLAKLGVHSRAQAAALAHSSRLLAAE